jgi:hypothetical protein
VFKAVLRACQGDSGDFMKMFAALVRPADDAQEFAEQAE